ncbi:putative riboflavin biosynthesis protein Rib7 [Acrodontium crateriforme]|uniref:2,5-diamino-6-ribosylamino-4(3H)-pyrimidinone 5'-phosphate reductase n=1 Tax=Acrodontium crateriforme TaxID=150365 RepID=A0AAQ3R8U2_9PEZI|nr:putative riboflavin biosynthesis protein Rib7 [Acrodontium crateriforme]
MPEETLSFSDSEREFLEKYLPPNSRQHDGKLPSITLTFATSLDSSIALAPGVRTQLSGPRSKAMTHYIRSRHDAILIGVGTAAADDPALNCRLEGAGGYGSDGLSQQPRPIVIDPSARWALSEQSRILVLAKAGRGRAPYILTSNPSPPKESVELLERYGGKYISMGLSKVVAGRSHLDWKTILEQLKDEGLHSIMVEGGGSIINSLLEPQNQNHVSSVIVTIAPLWLGQGGVVVSPEQGTDETGTVITASTLKAVKWHPLGEDIVLCGTF